MVPGLSTHDSKVPARRRIGPVQSGHPIVCQATVLKRQVIRAHDNSPLSELGADGSVTERRAIVKRACN